MQQIVATVRPHVLCQEIQVVQIVERIQEQIVEPIDVLAPAVTYASPNQQLPSIIKAVTPDVKFYTTGFVNPQFSTTVVEAYAPQAVGSFPPLLMRLCTTKFSRNTSLLEKGPRTHLKTQLWKNSDRSGNSSGCTLMSA